MINLTYKSELTFKAMVCDVKPPLQTEAHMSSLDIILEFQSKDRSHFKPQFQTENRLPSVEPQFHAKVHMLSNNNFKNLNDNPEGGGGGGQKPSYLLSTCHNMFRSCHQVICSF